MPDKKAGGEASRVSSQFVKSGDRKSLTVELRPGETTIVSWKKLMKDANKVNGIPAPVNAHPSLESRIVPVQAATNEVNDEPARNRFSAVNEKIERLYVGNDSSGDECPNDIPDDDQYDTEDSFIDDTELDEYFEVDNSAIKHDGFFVNRGKLEHINSEPTILPNQQPKKRRRKDLAKGNGVNDDGHFSGKQKSVKIEAAKVAQPRAKSCTTSAQTVAVSDASAPLAEAKETDKQKTRILSKDTSSKFKDINVTSEALQLKYLDISAYSQHKSQSIRPLSILEELESTTRAREKNGILQLPDLNTFKGKFSSKRSHMHKKEGSRVRTKGSMLEKAIQELEKMVAESRPPAGENQEADNLSQAVKRRLPTEIKLKLARVARLAQANHGKVSKELINRLMSSLGHIIQLRTLKRNLKIMINMSLSAKQEKENRFQQIKKEIVEMIKMRSPSLESKVFEHQAGASDDFQEITADGKEASKRKFMDATLENKICDLYDLYVDGMDEDVGPQVRKLYAELAELWPSGFMDNHGIKRAICRAKDRRRAQYNRNKDQEKIRRKKLLVPKMDETVRADANPNMQAQYLGERLAPESCSHSSMNKQVSSKTAAVYISNAANIPSFDRPKQDKFKRSSSNSSDDARVGDGGLTKKKVKRKPEGDLDETRFCREKLPSSHQGEEVFKLFKQTVSLPHKSNLQSTTLPSVQHSS